ncbi:hypothetical protein AB7G19_13700 [Bradyrhizobium sp. 215_C5_N1_1]
MTKELIRAGQCKLIVPTIFLTDYVGGLVKLFDPEPKAAPLVGAVIECQRIANTIVSPDLN